MEGQLLVARVLASEEVEYLLGWDQAFVEQ